MTLRGSSQLVNSEPIQEKTVAGRLQRLRQADEVDKADGQVNDAKHSHHDAEVTQEAKATKDEETAYPQDSLPVDQGTAGSQIPRA